MKRILVNLLFLIGLFSLSSCALSNLITGKVPARVPCEDKTFIVVPFGEETKYRSQDFYESTNGEKLSTMMTGFILNNEPDAKIARANRDFKFNVTNAFKEPEWDKLCKENDLDFIVFGKIVEYQLQNKRDLNIYQGRIVVKLTVIDKNNRSLVPDQPIEVVYPEPKAMNNQLNVGGAIGINTSREDVKKQLLHKTALKLSRVFYPYHEEEH